MKPQEHNHQQHWLSSRLAWEAGAAGLLLLVIILGSLRWVLCVDGMPAARPE